jgi:predicted nucleic acid-binding Zn ribbon protein
MSNDKIAVSISLSCKKCGNASISLPDDPSEDAIIKCPACGADLGSRGQLNAKIREGAATTVREDLRKALKDRLKSSANIKLKL